MPIEPVTTTSPRPVRRAVLRQGWRDLAFLHWAVSPAAVAPLLPPGTRPDELEGRSYIGLIPFRMVGAGLGRGPAVPWLGAFLETNVRLYSVDAQGRRGIVFRSLDADRLGVVLAARAVFGLPYTWSRMWFERLPGHSGGPDGVGTVLSYATRRRGGAGVSTSRLAVRVGTPIVEPSALELWLTCRWGLHNRWAGRTRYLPNQHGSWPLNRAEVLELEDSLVAAAGFPGLAAGPPDSVLWSRGVNAVFGPPLR